MFLFSVFLVSLFLPTFHSEFISMIVTYGKPTNYTNSISYATSTWDDCVIRCYKLPSCVLAYSPEYPIDCKLFNVNKVFEVEKLDASNGLLVAFKVANSQGTCPIGNNPPTFGDGPSHGSAQDEGGNYTYGIDYEEPKWKFNFTVTLICSDGWTMFSRPTTNWCIRVIGGPDVTYTQGQSLDYCQSVNSTLTGMETTDERDFIANTGVTLLGPDYPQFAGFWVSGLRKPECYADGWESISYCIGTDLQQFNYTDNYLINLAGYTWDNQQPDRNTNGVWQNCMQIWIRNEEKFPQYNYTFYENGNVDDAVCDVVDYADYHLRGFACGKLPHIPDGAG